MTTDSEVFKKITEHISCELLSQLFFHWMSPAGLLLELWVEFTGQFLQAPVPSILREQAFQLRPGPTANLNTWINSPISALLHCLGQIIALGGCDVERKLDKLFLGNPEGVRRMIQTMRRSLAILQRRQIDVSIRGPPLSICLLVWQTFSVAVLPPTDFSRWNNRVA